MKKFLLASVLAAGACTMASAADVVDVFDLDFLNIAAAMDGKEIPDGEDFLSTEITVDGMLTESGSTYKFGYLAYKGSDIAFGYSGFFTNIDNPSGLYLKNITITYNPDVYWASGTLYVRETPVEFHLDGADREVPNVGYDSTQGGYYPGNEQIYGNDYQGRVFEIEYPFQYFVLQPATERMEKIVITWSEEAPVPNIATPTIDVLPDATGATPSGTWVNMYCKTAGVDLVWDVTRNGEVWKSGVDVIEGEYMPIGVELEGEVGDEFTISCYGEREGYNTSETTTRSVTLTMPGLAAPEAPMFGRWAYWDAIQTRPYTIRNTNGVGTMIVTVNGIEYRTLEESIEFEVLGEIGDELTISAYIQAEGYVTSETRNYTGYVVTNQIAAPIFSPEGDEIIAGAQVRFGNSSSWMGQKMIYRINGGEWQDAESISSYTITLEGDALIEAQILADTEGEYSYYRDSEIASHMYKIEVLNPEFDIVLVPTTFDPEYASYWTVCDAVVDGVEWQYYGTTNGWNDSFNLNDEMYMRNLTPVENGIYAFKINQCNEYASDLVLYFSDEEIEVVDNEWQLDDEMIDNAVYVNWSTNGSWVNLAKYDEENGTDNSGKKFVLVGADVWTRAQVNRFVFSSDINTSVSAVEAAEAGAAVYTINGMRVSSDKLQPGLYIQVKDGKATKVLVK